MSDKETQSKPSRIQVVFLVCIIIWGILMIPSELKSKYIGTQILESRTGFIDWIDLFSHIKFGLHFYRELSY